MDNSFFTINRGAMGGWSRGLRAPTLSDGDVNERSPGFHTAKEGAREQLRRPRAWHQHAANDQISGDDFFFDVRAVGHHGSDMSAENVVHIAQAGRVDVEDTHVRAHADGDLASAGASDTCTNNHYVGWFDSRGAAQQDATATVLGLQAPSTDLDREPPGNFAHRCQ